MLELMKGIEITKRENLPGVDIDKEFEYTIRFSKELLTTKSLKELKSIQAMLYVQKHHMKRIQRKKQSVFELEGVIKRAIHEDKMKKRFMKKQGKSLLKRLSEI